MNPSASACNCVPAPLAPVKGLKRFVFDPGRSDLAATDAPTVATGRYVVASLPVPRGQVYIIKVMAFYAQERINTGTPTESFRMLDPRYANGFFSFEPLVNGQSPWLMGLDYNAPTLAAAALNKGRQYTGGISYISANPWETIQAAPAGVSMMPGSWYNPLTDVLVPSANTFQVIFSILPPAAANPLPAGGRFDVGGAGGTMRVDFAGCVASGIQMDEQTFAAMMEATALP